MSVSLLRVLRASKTSQSSTRFPSETVHPLAMIAVYDAPTAALCCDVGADLLLVGDSLGNVVLGFDSTVSVTLDMMLHHLGAVVRGARQSSRNEVPVVADLSFGTYATTQDAARNGAALMQAGAHGLKLEGAASSSLDAVRVLTQMGAPVVGHLGFTPQSALVLNGVVQGKTAAAARQLLEDARRLQDEGCVAIVLEAVPSEVAQIVTQQLAITTIGIGAGATCDGQVLVWHDLVGLSSGAPFRFVKRFAQAHETLQDATRAFVQEVHQGNFPTRDNEYSMPDAELALWREEQVRGEPEA